MAENNSYKYFFKNYGFFVLFVAVLILILFYSVKISNKFWQKNLKHSIEIVLDEKDPNCWTVGNYIQINKPVALNAAAFEARNRQSGELYNAIIIRMETNYGPIPAVYLIDRNNEINFVGYSSLHGRVSEQLLKQNTNMSIYYWKNKIKEFF